MAKYKIGEIAKDFGVKVTDVADILTKYFGEGQYKHSTVLESDRLDVLFDHFTQAQGFGDRKSVGVGKECRSRWSPYH